MNSKYDYEYRRTSFEQDVMTLLAAMRDEQDVETLRTIKARTDELFEKLVEARR